MSSFLYKKNIRDKDTRPSKIPEGLARVSCVVVSPSCPELVWFDSIVRRSLSAFYRKTAQYDGDMIT